MGKVTKERKKELSLRLEKKGKKCLQTTTTPGKKMTMT
jgi:hypothetical protein